ncbi:MAG: hypothetical protein EA350_12845 [Gemmatimonadales bacterium]|nr:MAG: hypothetical protein EA350_12845 [Gemmatimonadales bacterium]
MSTVPPSAPRPAAGFFLGLGVVAALAAATLGAPAAASAQSPVSPGTLSVSVGLDSTPEAGIWFTATTHTRIGLIGTLQRRSNEVEGPGGASESETWLSYSAGPALKWYLSGNQQRVAPFWYLAGTAGVQDRPTDVRTTTFTGNLGFGADWFVVPHVSLGGTTGLSFVRDRTSNGEETLTQSMLRTMTAGLQMHIYF